MTKGLVSILLTSYNRPTLIREAINSVLNQTYEHWELFIIDDNSNEETQKVISEYLSNHKIRFYKSDVKPENRWLVARYAENINNVIDKLYGEFTTYLTDDDYYLPNRLSIMVDYLNQHPEASVVYGRQKLIRDGKPAGIRAANRILDWAAGEVDHCSVMHRTFCFEKSGKWPTHNIRCADGEFWASLNRAGYKFYPVQEITDVKRYHFQDLSTKMDRGEMKSEPRE